MDYSVGSLADLITGSNTPNKPKVVKKAFKKQKNNSPETSVDNENSKLKKIKGNLLNKNQKALKSKNVENEQAAGLQSNNKNKKKKSIKKNKVKLSESNVNESEDNTSITEDKIKVNGRKRKSDVLASSLLDSDDESSPKKEKTDFQQNAERRIKKKVTEEKKAQDPEEVARTIFVGNVPIKIDKKKVQKYFKKYGPIETIRFRGIPVADTKTTKKVAAIKKEFNPKRSNVHCYIRFQNKEDALKAEAENGVLFEGHHLRVHSCESKDKPDETKAIFIGNLSFDAVEDELWSLFEECGPISYVRIIRDAYTGMGKGFAYVNFKDSDAVQLALEMENVKLKDRELRISLCNHNVAKKNRKFNKKKQVTQAGKLKLKKTFNKNSAKASGQQNGETTEANAEIEEAELNNKKKINKAKKQKVKKALKKNSEEETSAKQEEKPTKANAEFQGTKFNEKKKKQKVNKGLLEKKKLMKKIAPRVK